MRLALDFESPLPLYGQISRFFILFSFSTIHAERAWTSAMISSFNFSIPVRNSMHTN